jgi:hypothetical protein
MPLDSLRVTYAGLFSHGFPPEWEDQPACVLTGDTPESHHGLVIGVPCRLVADPESPLYFGCIGDLSPEVVRGMRKDAKKGKPTVVLLGARDDVRGVLDLFMRRVRVEVL